jgi:hypothetical protein
VGTQGYPCLTVSFFLVEGMSRVVVKKRQTIDHGAVECGGKNGKREKLTDRRRTHGRPSSRKFILFRVEIREVPVHIFCEISPQLVLGRAYYYYR